MSEGGEQGQGGLEALPEGLGESGVYQVMFRLPRRTRRRVGALGEQSFKAGLWVSTGAALVTLDRLALTPFF